MTAFDLDIVGRVRNECTKRRLPLDEQLTEFLLGCHLHDSGSTVAFHVDWIGTDLAFSPDVDVLEINDEEAIGYEVKGCRNGSVQKQQIYSGVGQALMQLSQPLVFTDQYSDVVPKLRRSFLVYPRGEIEASDEWVESLVHRVESIPGIGLKTVGPRGDVETVVIAEPDVPEDACDGLDGLALRVCKKQFAPHFERLLTNANSGKSVKNPTRGLEVLGENIADRHDIPLIDVR